MPCKMIFEPPDGPFDPLETTIMEVFGNEFGAWTITIRSLDRGWTIYVELLSNDRILGGDQPHSNLMK